MLIILPFTMAEFRVEQMCGWIALAIAACGLNLLTGYNGQISVGHGALYGVGAYTTALIVTNWQWPLLLATVASAVVCFVVGLLIGLPGTPHQGPLPGAGDAGRRDALPARHRPVRIVHRRQLGPLPDQSRSCTGAPSGIVPFRFDPPGGLASDQWKYFIFLAIAALCFVLSRNLIRSRVGTDAGRHP